MNRPRTTFVTDDTIRLELITEDESNGPVIVNGHVSFDPASDEPNESSSIHSGSSSPNEGSVFGDSVTILNLPPPSEIPDEKQETLWSMNYHEASIYLQEGYDNEKFDSHPKTKEALPSYLVVHNVYFYTLDLLASWVLLVLALVERPAVHGWNVPEWVHASLELMALVVMGIELFMKFRWMGFKQFFEHKRTMLKMTTLVIMIIEALVVLIRRDSHFRVTRALRPIFVIDNHYCGGIRRVLRQIIQSLPPILDMLFLLFFFMMIFSILGFYLFKDNPDDPYFKSSYKSFVNLFVLLTTANYPDVMMPAYAKNRWSAVFFVAFLIIHLYFLMNLMLAVVYETFTRIEKTKFRKLLLHRRKACQHAFRLLVAKGSTTRISFKHYHGLMKFYKPGKSKLDSYLMFKTLDVDESKYLTMDEFFKVYEVSELSWRRKHPDTPWYVSNTSGLASIVFSKINDLVLHKYFEGFVYFIITASALWQVTEAVTYSGFNYTAGDPDNWVYSIFVIIYVIEITLKLMGLGLITFLSYGWNVFDVVITLIGFGGLVTSSVGVPFSFLFILRSLRILKLLELKKRYKDIMGTFIFILAKRFGSVALAVLVLFYFYAVIGMELFGNYDLTDCCKNSSVETYFASGAPNSTFKGYYYLNNFSNIVTSFVTLFELMVVNNWFILMDGYAIVSSEGSRLYFMSFYIMTMIFITIVVAFILEAFLFRIQYRVKMGDIDKDTMVTVDQLIAQHEFIENILGKNFDASTSNFPKEDSPQVFTFHGSRQRSKFSFCQKMYADEVKEWLEKADDEDRQLLMESRVTAGLNEEDTHRKTEQRRALSCAY